MKFTNSSLVCYKKLSPNHSGLRNHTIDTITIHCMAGNMYIESCGEMFADPKKQVSSNYGIGSDGRIALYVEEKNRSWCSSNAANDNRAVTIEVANDGGENTGWHISDKAYKALVELCADICKRNGIKELKWKGNKSLIGQVDKQNMTVHRWFANKSCPGDYLYNLHGQIAKEVNVKLRAMDKTSSSSTTNISSTIKGCNNIYLSNGNAAIRPAASLSTVVSSRCLKNNYYVASQIIKPAGSVQTWFRHTDSGMYSAVEDTDGSKLFTLYGTYQIGVANTLCNVRAKAGLNGAVIDKLNKGDTVYLTDKNKTNDGIDWRETVYNGKLCWCDVRWVNIK